MALNQPKRIEIQNGTRITGLAYRTSQFLQTSGYQVINIGNAPTRDYQKTVVYDLRENDPEATKKIADLIKAEVAQIIPNWAKTTTTPLVSQRADILIILGQDQQN
jgi:hypothetical protein